MKNEALLLNRIRWEDIGSSYLTSLVSNAKAEDIEGYGLKEKPEYLQDVTSARLGTNESVQLLLRARDSIVLCGLQLLPIIIEVYEAKCSIKLIYRDGDFIPKGEVFAHLEGSASDILTMERIILNFLQHLSGIATQTKNYVDALEGSETRLLDTRKTTPGYRVLEKFAVTCGGAWNHRLGLYDRILIKDNHLAVTGNTKGERLSKAIKEVTDNKQSLLVEVEVDAIDQIEPVLTAGADIIMLDNFSNLQLKEAISIIGDKAVTEASGGITIERLSEIKNLGLNFISSGALIHQSSWVDIGLDWS